MGKRETIINTVQNIVKEYSQKLTLRQIYYRLVAKLIIPNALNEYKYLSSALVSARKSGEVPYDVIEDRTREVNIETEVDYETWQETLQRRVDFFKEANFTLPRNLYQPKITVIALEKQALEGVFQNCLDEMKNKNWILVVCRGYNSLTQLKDLADNLTRDEREIHCYFFSDFDPSGLDIQRNFEEQTRELGVDFTSFERVALTQKQVEQYQLPFAPVKQKDSRARNWVAEGVVELDALDPNILEDLIRDCVETNWDPDIEQEVKNLQKLLRRKYRRGLAEEIKKLTETSVEDSNEDEV